jgi:glycosyltransferase involved in cell wall biosynthesis
MNEKLLTIVVPVYNTEIYLKKCLDSVVRSNYIELLDIILVNDGSKDSSVEILREYETEHKESVRVIDKENGGNGSTINVGLDIAEGKYFRVLDSDDWFDTDSFDMYIDFLKTTDVDLVLTNYSREYIYSGESVFQPYEIKNIEYEKIYELDKCGADFFEETFIFRLATSTYKLSILKEADLKLIEKCFYVDMQYNIYPVPFVNTFLFLNYRVYRYFIGRLEQSINYENFVRNYEHHNRVLKDLMYFYIRYKPILPAVKSEYIKRFLIWHIYVHYSIGLEYDKNKKRGRKRARQFDKELKDINMDFYYQVGKKFAKIRINRKTAFLINRFDFIANTGKKIYYMLKK